MGVLGNVSLQKQKLLNGIQCPFSGISRLDDLSRHSRMCHSLGSVAIERLSAHQDQIRIGEFTRKGKPRVRVGIGSGDQRIESERILSLI